MFASALYSKVTNNVGVLNENGQGNYTCLNTKDTPERLCGSIAITELKYMKTSKSNQ